MTEGFLHQALEQARERWGRTGANPPVGAVIVAEGQVVGVGYHWGAGFPHAEVVALERAGERARGATLYVTLEPCHHHGRTPPCTEAVKAAGVARVVYGFSDPNPRVTGGGAAALREAGIPCELLPLGEVAEFYRPYAWFCRRGVPFVTAKLALSLDGKVAGPGGRPTALTGEAAAQHTHRWRRSCDALLTTVRTVGADDPRLNVRFAERVERRPVWVLDRRGEMPLQAKLWDTAESLTVVLGPEASESAQGALEARGARCLRGGGSGAEVLQWMGAEGIQHLGVEAGGKLFGGWVREGLVQRAWLYVAPRVVGEGVAAFEGDPGLGAARCVTWRSLGQDAWGTFEFEG